MRKIVILAVLMMAVTNCSYFSELNDIAENEKKERGRECMYNYKGELQGCNYIKQIYDLLFQKLNTDSLDKELIEFKIIEKELMLYEKNIDVDDISIDIDCKLFIF